MHVSNTEEIDRLQSKSKFSGIPHFEVSGWFGLCHRIEKATRRAEFKQTGRFYRRRWRTLTGNMALFFLLEHVCTYIFFVKIQQCTSVSLYVSICRLGAAFITVQQEKQLGIKN